MLVTGSVHTCVCLCTPLLLASSLLVGIINRKWEVSLARLHVTLHRAVCPALQLCCNRHGKTPGLYKDKTPRCFLSLYPDRTHPHRTFCFRFLQISCAVSWGAEQSLPIKQSLHVAVLWGCDPCREISDSREKNTGLKTESDKSSGGYQVMWLEGSSTSKRGGGIFGGGSWKLLLKPCKMFFNMKPKQSTALFYFYLFSYTFLTESLPNVSQSAGFKVSAHNAEQSLLPTVGVSCVFV